MAGKKGQGLVESEDLDRPVNASELIEILKARGIRSDRKYTIRELLAYARGEKEDPTNSFDPIRDVLIKWSMENWDRVKYYADCPLLKEDKCYVCSDLLVAACYAVNKESIVGKETDGEDDC